jgi:hypothetical protein
MPRERRAILFLVRVGLHGADLVHRLVDVGGDVGDAVLAVARQAAHAPAESSRIGISVAGMPSSTKAASFQLTTNIITAAPSIITGCARTWRSRSR